MPFFKRGIVLEQFKEPAFSYPLVRFVNPNTDNSILSRSLAINAQSLDADEIIDIAKEAQIIDARDGKLLHRKFLRAKGKAVAVIVDAVDDEPYVSSSINPLINCPEEAAIGIALCEKLTNTSNVHIMALGNTNDLDTRIPGSIEGYKITSLSRAYPARANISELNAIQGRKLVVGSGALIHLARAVIKNIRQTTAFVTVAGNCVANPLNLEVSIGMTVQQVLDRCGLHEAPDKVILGGPMTGISVIDTERTLVTHTTTAILAFRDDVKSDTLSCIGCARCNNVCPVYLNVYYIKKLVKSGRYEELKKYDAGLCMQCGTCSYICPARIKVANYIAKAKEYSEEHFPDRAKEEDGREL